VTLKPLSHFVALGCIFSATLIYGGDSAPQLADAIRASNIKWQEKLLRIRRFEVKLDEISARSLILLNPTIDLELIPELTLLIAENGFADDAILHLAKHVKKCAKADPSRAITLVNVVLRAKYASTRPKWLSSLSTDLFEILADAEPPKFGVLMKGIPTYYAKIICVENAPSFKKLLINKIGSGHAASCASWLADTKAGLFLSKDDITILVDTLLLCIEQRDEAGRLAVSKLLTQITRQKEPDDAPPEYWREWWDANRDKFSIAGNAITIAEDKNAEPELRATSIANLALDTVPEIAFVDAWKCLHTIAFARDEQVKVRVAAVQALATCPKAVYSATEHRELTTLLQSLIDDEFPEIATTALRSYVTLNAIPVTTQNFLFSILGNSKKPPILRAHAARYLADGPRKRDSEKPLREFLRHEVEANIHMQEPPPHVKVAIFALEKITGQEFENETKAWLEFKRRHGKIKDTDFPMAKDPPKNIEPAAKARGLDNATEDGFKISPSWIESVRKANIKLGSRSSKLTLGLQLSYGPKMEVIGTAGYVVEALVTDKGESVKTDWQATALSSSPLRMINLPFPSNGAKVGDNEELDQRVKLDIVINLGNPESAFSGLQRVKGYLKVKCGIGVKEFKFVGLDEYLEKRLDIPECPAVKQMQIYITGKSGNVIKLEHSNNFSRFNLLKELSFLDENGSRINFDCRPPQLGDGTYRFEFRLAKPLPASGSLVLTVYDEIKDHQIPFDLKDLILDVGPIKPPLAPEF